MSDLFTYFAFSRQSKLWKIGRTRDPKQRFLGLLGKNAGLVIHALFSANTLSEKDAHYMFRAHRVHGEWFKDNRAIKKFIRSGGSLINSPIECSWDGLFALGVMFPQRAVTRQVAFSSRDISRVMKRNRAPVFGFLILDQGKIAFRSVPLD